MAFQLPDWPSSEHCDVNKGVCVFPDECSRVLAEMSICHCMDSAHSVFGRSSESWRDFKSSENWRDFKYKSNTVRESGDVCWHCQLVLCSHPLKGSMFHAGKHWYGSLCPALAGRPWRTCSAQSSVLSRVSHWSSKVIEHTSRDIRWRSGHELRQAQSHIVHPCSSSWGVMGLLPGRKGDVVRSLTPAFLHVLLVCLGAHCRSTGVRAPKSEQELSWNCSRASSM